MLTQIHDILEAENRNLYEDYISAHAGRNIIIYGAGGVGYATWNILKDKGLHVCCFIDDDKSRQNKSMGGIKVVPLKDLQLDNDCTILICTPNPLVVYEKLKNLGYENMGYFPVLMAEKGYYNAAAIRDNEAGISKIYDLLADPLSRLTFCNILKHRITYNFSYFDAIVASGQYFPDDIFALTGQECFVDGGAYRGETVLEFVNKTGKCFQYIYAFEPDMENFQRLKENTVTISEDRLRLINAGLYSQTGTAGFNCLGNSGSFISASGKDMIKTVPLDETIGEFKPTYIKLDIEGAEIPALEGMKKTIAEYRPKLAVSIYHKPEDLWEIPAIIKKLNPAYRIYIRHYSHGLNETVCYAI